jgi:hypothetical protein
MPQLPTSPTNSRWFHATAVVLLGIAIWQIAWIAAAYLFTGGKEFADDSRIYVAYVNDPGMLWSERHRAVFGAAVAPPLLAAELKVFHSVFERAGDFLAFRITMLLHMLFAYGAGFAVAFRYLGVPDTWRGWARALAVAMVPVGWVTVLTVQDDSVAAAWGGLILLAYVWRGPVVGAIAAGCGMFFGKILLGLALLALWIASPGRRFQVAAVGAAFLGILLGFLFWRDGGLVYSEYVYIPYMGASVYGLVWMLASEFDLLAARDLSAIVTMLAFGAFTWIGVRRRLSIFSAVTAVHSLFLMTYFGAMPDYYAWFFPFLVVTLWACCQRGYWGTFAVGWLSSFFAYGYKVAYGLNSHFPSDTKPALKTWAAENIPFNINVVQIATGFAAVICTLLFAALVLYLDPTKPAAGETAATNDGAGGRQEISTALAQHG